ncbi:hypothetical protein BD626DRAFT_392530 [Schizophyllum amplum]|uniref:DUF7729 domain-containing protein n=1 Tax=Schizophyllum amplum TaxID=97359 RepID=A0A550CW97_9AGAR|nr:hypothetical protein BD626DRAFT_392530 [Auriculariopsis ampla]
MFTPPPSPLPGQGEPSPIDRLRAPAPAGPSEKLAPPTSLPPPPSSSSSSPDEKRRIGKRIRWTALVIPLLLILITASTRYITHPAAFDVLAGPSDSVWADLTHWAPHKRHPQNDDAGGSTSVVSVADTASLTTESLAIQSTFASDPTTAPTATSTAVPTVPANPVLPTPFPQPFDSDITQNYSSVSCFNLFNNMTNTEPFRRCRAFSLLWQSSSAFISAQTNATLMNTLVWGTCNTPLDANTCSANMAWFAGELESACAADLLDGNARVTETLTAIRAYDVMREAACLVDETTNAYCFVNAVSGTNSADQYAYNLPLGLAMPTAAEPTCSTCVQDILGLYADALQNGTATLDGLRSTYEDAVDLTNQKCGPSYATAIVTNENGAPPRWRRSAASLAVLAVAIATLL